MRHAKPSREDFSVESSLLSYTPTRCFDRAFGAATHILGLQLFGCDQGAALHQRRGLLVNEVPAQVGDPLMQTTDLVRELPVSV